MPIETKTRSRNEASMTVDALYHELCDELDIERVGVAARPASSPRP